MNNPEVLPFLLIPAWLIWSAWRDSKKAAQDFAQSFANDKPQTWLAEGECSWDW